MNERRASPKDQKRGEDGFGSSRGRTIPDSAFRLFYFFLPYKVINYNIFDSTIRF
jgi:hypothetical protein